jgi:hypothetical protein
VWHSVFHGTIFAGNEMWSLEQTELQHGTYAVTVQSGASLKHEGGNLNGGCGLHDHTRCVCVCAVHACGYVDLTMINSINIQIDGVYMQLCICTGRFASDLHF